ncbi:GNAT family N-acetyltransferase [Nocardioides sp. CCNWLW239]|uniref:GNAT family N-acetyltransferase n=1 Tax=Nocardioides sp. CCNWLW239 TaxID=3128902 RepID=UPI0030178DB6
METRTATTTADFETAATLQVSFNTEYDYPAPPAEELALHLGRLVEGCDTTVMLIGDPTTGEAFGHGITRFRLQTTADELEAYLAELYVVPSRRGQGLGTILLQAIIDEAKARGATYMDLGTSEDDTSARALYEKFGFDNHEGRGSGARALYYEKEL